MNKALRVARREFLENVRTKTFWIGILALPVILVLSIFVPAWLQSKTGIRKYAVVDESGWLDAAIEASSSFPDVEAMLKDEAKGETLPTAITDTGFWQLCRQLEKEQRSAFVRGMAKLAAFDEKKLEQVMDYAKIILPKELLERLDQAKERKMDLLSLRQQIGQVRDAIQSMDDGDRAARYLKRLGAGRFAKVTIEGGEEACRKAVNDDEIFAFFVIPKDPIGKPKGAIPSCRYISNNLTDNSLRSWYTRRASEQVRNRRMLEMQLAPEAAAWIERSLVFSSKKVTQSGEEKTVEASDKAMGFAPIIFVYILWMSVFMIAQMLLTNTIEEKSNRIIEVLLSSVSPLQLMSGKIFGLAMTGVTVVGSWAFFFFLAVKIAPSIEPMAGQVIEQFKIGSIVTNPIYLASFVIYFVLGYLFYASLLVAIGSVCNSLKEAQNLMQPVIIVLMMPLLSMIPISNSPNGTIAKVLSYIPPFTPFVMMNRVAGPPPIEDYIFTSILLIVSILFMFYMAAKVFRIGILMTGKPPKIREILRWMRAPVGTVPVRKE